MMQENLGQLTGFLMLHPVASYIAAVSFVTAGLFGYDKAKARAGLWRTPEKTLLLFCLAGGTLGGGLGMWMFRHKISKRSFLQKYFVVAALQGACAAFFLLGGPALIDRVSSYTEEQGPVEVTNSPARTKTQQDRNPYVAGGRN